MARLPLNLVRNNAPSAADLLNEAVARYQHGDFAGARRNLKVVLRKAPQLFDALHLMGLLETQRGHHKDAEVLLRQAVRINPRAADAQANRGNVLRELGRFDEAVASYDRALEIKPDYANALNGRAIALMALGRHDEALACYDRALTLDSTFASAIYNRAVALVQLDRLDEAVAAFDQVLARDPTFVQGNVDRGNALAALGRTDDALAAYDRALTLEPGFTAAHYNRGLALLRAARFADALVSFDAVLAIDGAAPNALDGKGNALAGLGRADEALAAFAAAVKANPKFVGALNNMGLVLLKLRRPAEALVVFDKALRIDSTSTGVLINRGNALLALGRTDEAMADFGTVASAGPGAVDALANRASAAMSAKRYDVAASDFERVVERAPDHPYALGSLLYARLHCSDWRDFNELQERIAQRVRAGHKTILPFEAVACLDSPSDQQRAAAVWVDDVCPVRASHISLARRDAKKIRVAYLSCDFRQHPVAILIAELIEKHDRDRFEILALSFGNDDRSAMRSRLERSFDAFHDVRALSDQEIASRIRELAVDILVDLTGFTENCRPGILALRPAPIQVSYLGYLGTMGSELIDYVIADRLSLSDSIRAHYDERVAYLPDTLIVADTTRRISDQALSRSDLGLPTDGTVFCAFHSRHKITPPLFSTWMRILHAVDGSVLWLAGGSAVSNENLRREAQARGIAAERLVVMPLVSNSEEYLARYTLADIFLDVLPYNAISTAADALWAGLPIVTCLGNTFGGRGAGSMLHAVGLPELVCDTLDTYESTAVKLAREPALLSGLKATLTRDKKNLTLFDTDRFRRHIEAAFSEMWEQHRRGQPPADFTVSG